MHAPSDHTRPIDVLHHPAPSRHAPDARLRAPRGGSKSAPGAPGPRCRYRPVIPPVPTDTAPDCRRKFPARAATTPLEIIGRNRRTFRGGKQPPGGVRLQPTAQNRWTASTYQRVAPERRKKRLLSDDKIASIRQGVNSLTLRDGLANPAPAPTPPPQIREAGRQIPSTPPQTIFPQPALANAESSLPTRAVNSGQRPCCGPIA